MRLVVKNVFGLLFVFSILICQNGQGKERLKFEQLTTANGLSNGTVNKIYRDKRGYVWVCTEDGLNKFDGYNFKIYQPEIEKKSKIVQFKDIAEDRFGNLWLATSLGLFHYRRDLDALVYVNDIGDDGIKETLPEGLLNCVYYDSHDNLWIGSYEGLSKLHVKDTAICSLENEDFVLYKSDQSDPESISTNHIMSITEDKNGNVWVSNYSRNIDIYVRAQDKFRHKKISGLEKSTRLFKGLNVDAENNVWCYTEGKGIFLHENDTDGFHPISINDDAGEINTRFVRSLIFDIDGNVWMGTDGNGVVVWNRKKQAINHYRCDVDDNSNLSSNGIYSIYEDVSGTIWVGTYMAGINKYIAGKSEFGEMSSTPFSNHGLSNNMVTGFCEDHKGQIWIATDGGGLNVMNPETFDFKYYKHNSENPASISTNVTIALFEDANKYMWVGTYSGGLNRFDPKTKTFDHYWHDANDSTTISSNHPWGFAQDKNKNLWIATVDRGLNLLKPNSQSFIRYAQRENKEFAPEYLCSNAITYVYIDSKQNLWICTEEGLDKVNLNDVDFSEAKPELTFQHYRYSPDKNSISSNRISYITEDAKGTIWIGTADGGLNSLDVEKNRFKVYTKADGLPHYTIQGILFDEDQNLWISTNNGLSKFNVESQSFKNYPPSAGLQSASFFKTACAKTSRGMMLFGGVNGLNAFYPARINANKQLLDVVLTNFNLFNKPIAIGEKVNKRVILPRAIEALSEIQLCYNENFFSLHFAALDYISPERNKFSYILEGFDKEWRRTDAKNRIATYTNLDPGEYTFKVISTSFENEWNDSGTQLRIIIHPPWWETWGFRIGLAIVILGLVTGAFYRRISRLKKHQKILEMKVTERTEQLQLANLELKEINTTKDKIMSIIAHDIINPFNTILGFSELLLQNFKTWTEKEKLETVNLISDSSKRLFELLENLLQWSRSERGMLKCQTTMIDLSETIHQIEYLLRYSAEAKSIRIEISDENAGVMVNSDPNVLNTILRNLLSNAIKFTPEKGLVRINVKTDDAFVYVSVIDNGVGISQERIRVILNGESTESTGGTNGEKGTGLGLPLVKDFVAKQGGRLCIESVEGEFSKFTFGIPLK